MSWLHVHLFGNFGLFAFTNALQSHAIVLKFGLSALFLSGLSLFHCDHSGFGMEFVHFPVFPDMMTNFGLESGFHASLDQIRWS